MTDAYLGFDVGTSSSKGVLVAPDGTVVASAVREHEVSRPRPGHVEMAAEIWWEELLGIVAELTAGREVTIAGIGLSGMGPCVLVTDAHGTPLRPAILYGVDTRAGEQIARIEAELGAEAVFDSAGSPLSSQSAGPKLAWIAENEPEVWGRARRFFMPASWLAHRLTGAYRLDQHSASQCTPLHDRHRLAWNLDWAQVIAPGLELPDLAWAGELAGRTTDDFPGIPAGTPVSVGTIDAWAEASSAGADTPGDLFLMYGTTMFLILTADDPLRSPAMWGTVGVRSGARSLAGGMATSGAITQWLRTLTGTASFEPLLAGAAESGPGARGLLMLPHFAGERTPVLDPDARGLIAGLTLEHGAGDLYRAALEATAYGVRHNLDAMTEAGGRVERVVAAGGGTASGLWLQIVSDVTGLTQIVPSVTIGASYGAARLMAEGLGANVSDWNPSARRVEPDAANRRIYDDGYALYREAYPLTRELSHRLAARQRAH